MKRGEIWTVAGGGYAGKPRPAVILQADAMLHLPSVTVCIFTSDPRESDLLRLAVDPTPGNGLKVTSRLMIDKISTVPSGNIGRRIGRLGEADMKRLSARAAVFLGLDGAEPD